MSIDIADAKRRVSIADYLDRHTSRPRQTGNWLCPLPEHDDSTPSFSVTRHDSGDGYRCFGCGASGDIIGLIEALEGIGKSEAIERLGALAGVESVPDVRPSAPKELPPISARRLEPAQHVGRTIIGAQADDVLDSFAQSRGWSRSTLDTIGCSVVWRHGLRVRFPFDCNGSYYADRSTDATEPKWMSAKGTARLYRSSALDDESRVVVVTEGVTDAVALLDICTSYPVVGVPGSSFCGRPGERVHGNAIRVRDALADRVAVVVCPDNDEAGRCFAKRIVELVGVERCAIAVVPDGHSDVADWLASVPRNERADAFLDCITDANEVTL